MSSSHVCSLICHFLVSSLQFISFPFSWFILLLCFQIFESEFPICLLFFLFTDTSVTVTWHPLGRVLGWVCNPGLGALLYFAALLTPCWSEKTCLNF